MAQKTDEHVGQTGGLHHSGRAGLSRRRLMGLGAAAGLTSAAMPLARAYASWESSLPRSLRGTVSFCAYLYGAPQGVIVTAEQQPNRLFKKYTQMHSGTSVQLVAEPSYTVDWNAWFLTRAIANRAPDLLQWYPASGLPYVSRGFLTPITKYLFQPNPYIPGNKRWIDSLPKDFLKPFIGLDGEYYGVGADTSAIWVYYNPDHLDRIGMKPPSTWAEMMQACASLKSKGITPYSQANGMGYDITWWFVFAESSLWASEFPPGTTLDLASWVKAVKKGLLKKTDARTREAWQIMKAFGAYWQRGAVAGAGTKLYNDFANGKITFIQDGSWEISTLEPLLKNRFPLRALPTGIPPITKETSRFANGSLQDSGVGALNGVNLWVTSHAKDHLDLVMDFAAYYSSPQVIGSMAVEVGEVPMTLGVGHLPPLIQQAKDVAAQPMLLGIPYYSASVQYTAAYDKLSQGYLAGAISLDSALGQLENLQQTVVAKLASQMRV
jgi:multiple sugar transport system substrate-binding protein